MLFKEKENNVDRRAAEMGAEKPQRPTEYKAGYLIINQPEKQRLHRWRVKGKQIKQHWGIRKETESERDHRSKGIWYANCNCKGNSKAPVKNNKSFHPDGRAPHWIPCC